MVQIDWSKVPLEDEPVKAEQTHGEAYLWLGKVLASAVTDAYLTVSQTPVGAANWRDVDAALVVAINACGKLIRGALRTHPDGNDLDPEWQDFKAAITGISRAMNEALNKK